MGSTISKYILISSFVSIILIVNLYIWQNTIIGFVFGLFFLLSQGAILGHLLFPQNSLFFKIFYGLFFLLSGIALIGALIYYFYCLNLFVIALIIILIPIFLSIIVGVIHELPLSPSSQKTPNLIVKKRGVLKFSFSPELVILILAFLFLITVCFSILFSSQTMEAIASPWQVIPTSFFIIYFFVSLALIGITFYSPQDYQNQGLILFLISLYVLLSVSVALIIYQLGYGFDLFIHQATEKVIAERGFIAPKPFYYLGQYSLVVFFSKLFAVPVKWPDKLIVPIFTSLWLPFTIYWGLSQNLLKEKKYALLSPLIFLILPFSVFIVTTPQNLANFYSLIIIFSSLPLLVSETKSFRTQINAERNNNAEPRGIWPLSYLIFLSLVTLAIHPLAGIPVFIFLVLLILLKIKTLSQILKKIIFWEVITLFSIIIPLVFIIFSSISSQFHITLNTNFGRNFFYSLNIFTLRGGYWNYFRSLYDLIYLYGFNTNLLFLILSLIGIIILSLKNKIRLFKVYILTFLILIINYILLKGFISFSSLIEYERYAFIGRILEIGLYFLTPFFLYAFYIFSKRLWGLSSIFKFAFMVCLSLALTASLYLSYPRNDRFEAGHNFNVSSSDIKAVHSIENDAAGDYIVLANQSVSAAAIREFGFKKYYGEHFYYPIPTGGVLYSFYLKMTEGKPEKEKMRNITQEVMDLVPVKTVYFVINEYWHNSSKIIQEAKKTTNIWTSIDDGRVFVFK
ncbi:MAG: hypothetical protein COX43_00840, partial [Parcubacteria group bacterium CG23_combo_of_CG06-09_8_20_14_all_35_9]